MNDTESNKLWECSCGELWHSESAAVDCRKCDIYMIGEILPPVLVDIPPALECLLP